MDWMNQNSNDIVGKTIAEQVTNKLRYEIIRNIIPVGSQITVKAIAERYNVGLMPVRDAFKILNSERLLEITPYKNARVLKIDKKFISNVYDIVRQLERMMAEELAISGDKKVIGEMQEINEQIKNFSYSIDAVPDYLKLNYAFHMKIADASANDIAISLYKYYWEGILISMRQVYFSSLSRFKEIIREHDAIIEAIRAGDVEKTDRCVKLHAIESRKDFMEKDI